MIRRALARLPRAFRDATYHLSWFGAAAGIVALHLLQPSLAMRGQDQVFDLYQRLRPRAFDADAPVKVIDIDDQSIARFGQWPWPRSRIAELVDRLREARVAAIAFDMVFSEPDRTSADAFLAGLPDATRREAVRSALGTTEDNDARLARSIEGAPVVLGAILTQGRDLADFAAPYGFATAGDDPRGFAPDFSGAVVPLAGLLGAAHGLGAVNWLADNDQIVRRVPLVLAAGGRLVPSLAMESVRVAQGASSYVVRASAASGDTALVRGIQSVRVGAVTAASGTDGSIRLHFTPHRAERFVSAGRVLDGSVDRVVLEGSIVVVGSSSPGLVDIRATPVDPAMPGVEVQAQAVEAVLSQAQLLRPGWATAETASGVLLAAALAVLLPFVPALVGAAAAAGLVGATGAASWWAFSSLHMLLDPVAPGALVIASYLGATSALFRAEQRDRRFVQGAFGRFVSPDVVSRLTRDPRGLVLGGEQRELTVMFTDIRNFSAIAERMSAQDLTRFMNRYLSPMTEIVLAHAGTVDKYIGDAIMAFWNAPLPDPAHAEHAVRAALAMLAALPGLRSELAATDADLPPIRCGIGLASGPCVVGNLGSNLRFDYSALGDDVNLASRLEGLTKLYGLDILATEGTRRLAPDMAWLTVDTVVVAGRTAATQVATLVGDETLAGSDDFRALSAAHDAMLVVYRSGHFDAALASIGLLRATAPASLSAMYDAYAQRCRAAMEQTSEGWDPIRRLSHK